MKEIYIRGYKVKYDENARGGIDYLLSDLDAEEARVFFEQARMRGSAKFEDDQDINYTLSYNPDGSYSLIRRG